MDSFVEAGAKYLEHVKFGTARHIWSLVERYRQFVASCEEGYAFGYDEFCNDIAVREVVQAILDLDTPQDEQSVLFQRQIHELDATLKSVSIELDDRVGKEWWKRIILKRAFSDYAQEVLEIKGVDVEVIQ